MKISRKVLFLSIITLVLLAAGCGSGGGTAPPPPPTDVADPSVAIQSPTSEISYLTAGNQITIGGIASDDIGVTLVTWDVDTGGSGDAVGNENWSASGIPLVYGDNTITVSAFDAVSKSSQDELIVTVNEYLTFLGKPKPVPSGFFISTPTEVLVSITIAPNLNLNESSVHLLELDNSNQVIEDLGQMYDDGELAHGDDIKGDSVYSYIGTFEGSSPGEIRLRVTATTTETVGDIEAFSTISLIYVVEDIPENVANAVVATQEEGDSLYYSYLSGNTPDEAKQLTIAWLEEKENVVDAVLTGSGDIWIEYTRGLTGSIVFPEEETYGGTVAAPQGRTESVIPAENQTVGFSAFERNALTNGDDAVLSTNALIYAPAHTEVNGWTLCASCNFAQTANTLLEDSECPTFDITYLRDTAADLDAWDDISHYGLIIIMTHGFLHSSGEVAFFSGEDYSFFGGHLIDWILGRLTTSTYLGRTVWSVRPGFISSRSGTMPNSIVFNCACYNANNDSLADAFIAKGASTYFGFTLNVSAVFVRDITDDLFPSLVTQLQSTDVAFAPGQTDPLGDPAVFRMIPATSQAYFEAGLTNGGFEEGSLTGWNKNGDGRVITQLVYLSPTAGSYMGIISTGLGFTTTTGSISQSFCVADTDTTLSLKWNFISEEFMEWIGSQYQDYFGIKLIESDGTEHILFYKTIDDIDAEYSLKDVSPEIVFDQGDAYMTGWETFTYDITAFRGVSLTLILESGDKGDSIYDTAILLDEIKLE